MWETPMKQASLKTYKCAYAAIFAVAGGFVAARYYIVDQFLKNQAHPDIKPLLAAQLNFWISISSLAAILAVTVFVFCPLLIRLRQDMDALNEAKELFNTERALRLQEEKYRNLLEAAPDAIIIIGPDNLIQLVNKQAEEIFGYARGEMIGQKSDFLLPERTRQQHMSLREAYIKNPQIKTLGSGGGLLGLRKNGSEFPLEVNLSPLEIDGVITITVSIRDATETRMQEKLATLGQLSGNIAHELRNPLATIDSSAYIIKKKVPEADPKIIEHLDRIQNSVKTATSVIESLLNLTWIKNPLLLPVDLVKLVSAALKQAKLNPEIKVDCQFDAEAISLLGDSQQLQILLVNIINNSIDAMNGKGDLKIHVYKTQVWGKVDITDTGPGISPAVKDKIFNPLFSTKATGTGLGLPIAKMIVDRHKGQINVESEIGKGATFSVILPLLDSSVSPLANGELAV